VVFDLLVVLLAAAGVVFLLKLVFGLLLMPVRGKGCRVCVTVSIEGDTPDIERVIRGARWLAQEGSISLVLVDKGMGADARKAAEMLAADEKCPLYTAEDLRNDLTEII
jgi:hypothetical protein